MGDSRGVPWRESWVWKGVLGGRAGCGFLNGGPWGKNGGRNQGRGSPHLFGVLQGGSTSLRMNVWGEYVGGIRTPGSLSWVGTMDENGEGPLKSSRGGIGELLYR